MDYDELAHWTRVGYELGDDVTKRGELTKVWQSACSGRKQESHGK